MEEGQFESAPQFAAPAPKKKINKRFLYAVAVIIFLILAFAGYKILGTSNSNNIQKLSTPTPTIPLAPTDTPVPTQQSSSPTPKPTVKPTATNTPTPQITSNPIDKTTGLDRSKLTVTVENGSGEAGVASSGKDFLNGLGYDVTGTSNADNFDYTGVTIQVKSGSSDYLALLKSDLGDKYTITAATSDLSDSNSTDALVIIGK